MKLRKISLLISMLVMGGVNYAHADLTCTLNQSTTGASASGTLTVNSIGSGLTATNFTAWNITVTTNNSVNFTQSNSTLVLAGSVPPTVVSTASSLTITPVAAASLPVGGDSYFDIDIGGFSGQFYGLFSYEGMGSFETFRYDGTSTGQIINNSPPTSLNLTCTCVTGGGVTCPGTTVSAPIDFSFNHKQPETYSEEISIK